VLLLNDKTKSSFLYGDSVRTPILPHLLEFLSVVLLLFEIGNTFSGEKTMLVILRNDQNLNLEYYL
jgi:hypothetical protein